YITAPVLPARLASQVEAIHGLDDRPAARRRTPNTGPAGGYTPDQLKSLYSLRSAPLGATDGSGVTIGVLALTNFNPDHIATYDSRYYPSTVVPAPIPVVVSAPDMACCTNQLESELDIEVIQAIAPQATIKVYEASNTNAGENAAYSQMVSDRVNVISTSWGQCEQLTQAGDSNELPTLHRIFQQAALAGINVYAATGDGGAFDCVDPAHPSYLDTTLAVDSPASDPNVIGVGGTTLLNSGDFLTFSSERAWAPAQNGGGGGGLSTVYAAPDWQVGDGVNSGMRQLPDVSFDGDPTSGVSVCSYSAGGGDTMFATPCSWQTVGGTSVGAPAWAAYNAIYNQYARGAGASPMGGAPAIYAAAQCHDAASPLHDTTVGNQGYYSPQPGFDLATGWGTMNGAGLASNIQAQPTAPIQVRGVSPNRGWSSGGGRVTISGCAFRQSGGSPPSVSFGGQPATSVTWISSTQLAATVPPGPVQTVNVTVTNPRGGASTLSGGFTFVQPPPPPPPGPPPPAGGTNLYGTLLNGGNSGVAELHGLSQQTHYTQFMLHAASAFGSSSASEWQFAVAPFGGDGQPDLVGVHLRNTASHQVEVHVLSAASGYQEWILHTATPLGEVSSTQFQFALGSLGGDRRSNLFAIAMNGTSSGSLEVHALSDSSGYNSWILHSTTAYGPVSGDQWQFKVGDRAGRGDLVGIIHSFTGSGRTEVHVLTRDSGYQGFSVHTATPLETTADSQW
ncbi:MAG: IPT/TIG domain-containing protein, partial [Candidatus Dormibacteraeota bacterium]|nr:IPT/TIG domain-containing protein [Candidatus Dormibacteraeota bacterium]